jgi:hypothetical protein
MAEEKKVKSSEDNSEEKSTKEKEKGKTTRLLIIVAVVLVVLSSPLWLCGGCATIGSLLPDSEESSNETMEPETRDLLEEGEEEMQDQGSEDGDEASQDGDDEDQSEEPEQEVVKISYGDLMKKVEENEARTKSEFEGKLIEVTGYVDSVDEEMLGSGYNVTLTETPDDFEWSDITAKFTEDKEDVVLALNSGEEITVRGEFDSITLGSVFLKDCIIID